MWNAIYYILLIAYITVLAIQMKSIYDLASTNPLELDTVEKQKRTVMLSMMLLIGMLVMTVFLVSSGR